MVEEDAAVMGGGRGRLKVGSRPGTCDAMRCGAMRGNWSSTKLTMAAAAANTTV